MSEIQDKARALLSDRMDSIAALESGALGLAESREAVKAAERIASEAWAAARTAGWSTQELRSLGFVEPTDRRGGRRPTGSRSRRAAQSSSESGE